MVSSFVPLLIVLLVMSAFFAPLWPLLALFYLVV